MCIAEFLDDVQHRCHGILEVMNRLLEINEEYFNAEVYNEVDYRYVKIASWVEKVKDSDGTHDNLFLLLSDIHRNGYEPVEVNKKFVVYDVDNDEFLDKDGDFVPMNDAVKFIVENYEIREVYVDED